MNYKKELSRELKRQAGIDHQERARAVKCDKLLDILRQFRYSINRAEKMDKKEWAVVSKAAGVHPPSEVVKGMVITKMREQGFPEYGKIGESEEEEY